VFFFFKRGIIKRSKSQDETMLRYINNRQAQAVVHEYALVIFLVIGLITTMAVYFKRGFQARIHDARDYMVDDVSVRAAGNYYGNLYLHYEPYYTKTDAETTSDASGTTLLLPGQSSGIFRKDINERTTSNVSSETAPPRDFDLTTPR